MSWVVIVTVLGLVGGAPRGETPRVADSSAAGAGRIFHNSVPPPKLNRLGNPPRTMCNVRPFNQLAPRLPAGDGPRRRVRLLEKYPYPYPSSPYSLLDY